MCLWSKLVPAYVEAESTDGRNVRKFMTVVITTGNNSNIWLPSGDWQLLPPVKEA